jgi:hypothetical protein
MWKQYNTMAGIKKQNMAESHYYKFIALSTRIKPKGQLPQTVESQTANPVLSSTDSTLSLNLVSSGFGLQSGLCRKKKIAVTISCVGTLKVRRHN